MNFLKSISNANTATRKQRHKRLQTLSPLFKKWERVERELSSREKKLEKNFFWQVTSLSTLLFFILSLFPQFITTAEEFWATPQYTAMYNTAIDQEIGLSPDGYIIKPEIITDNGGDRTGLKAREYVVQPGDTLSEIAQIHGVSTYTIMQNNDMYNSNSLRAGTVLKIPPVDSVIHEVEDGDTLDAIVKEYANDGVEKERIIAQNNLDPEQPLTIGAQLVIPGAKKDLPTPPRPVITRTTSWSAPTGGVNIPDVPYTGGNLQKPTSGVYTQYYRYGHYAVDIAGQRGTPILAAESGVVEKAAYGWGGGYGNHVIINHGNGLKTLYAHNDQLWVSVGQTVGRGAQIATMGNTGRVYGRTGIHLHFEVRQNGVKQNPLKYF